MEAIGRLQSHVEANKRSTTDERLNSSQSNEEQLKDSEVQELEKCLKQLGDECQKSVPHRVLAAKHHANEILLQLLNQQLNESTNESFISRSEEFICILLETLNKLYNKQPDIFNAFALSIMLQLLDVNITKCSMKQLPDECIENQDANGIRMMSPFVEEQILGLCLQLLQKVGIMHEINRQNIFAADIVKYLQNCIQLATKLQRTHILRESLGLCRVLVLDDDIRVEFGCAHEHARQLASVLIVELTELLKCEGKLTQITDNCNKYLQYLYNQLISTFQ